MRKKGDILDLIKRNRNEVPRTWRHGGGKTENEKQKEGRNGRKGTGITDDAGTGTVVKLSPGFRFFDQCDWISVGPLTAR